VTLAGVFAGIDTPSRIVGTLTAGVVIEAAVIWRFGWSAPLAAYSFLAVVGALVSATDLAARRVPNSIVLLAYPVAAALLTAASAPSGWWWPLARAGIAAAVLSEFYLAIGFAFPAGMGLGDVKWAGVLGTYLGWLNWSAALTGTLLAFLAATRIAGRRLVSVPMVPFMTFGAVVAVVATR
jgi:leader peptidase (prepilin peptidase)/N-methyltransferase